MLTVNGSSSWSRMMKGKTVIVTGANSGIGRATAAGIVKLQGRVIMACRDTSRAEEAAQQVRQETGADSTQLVVKHLDLASLTSVHTFCQDVIKVAAAERDVTKRRSLSRLYNLTCLRAKNVTCQTSFKIMLFFREVTKTVSKKCYVTHESRRYIFESTRKNIRLAFDFTNTTHLGTMSMLSACLSQW